MSLSAVNVTTDAAQIVAPNLKRRLLIIQNVSDADIFLKLDSSATALTAANGLKLAVGDPALVIAGRPGDYTAGVSAIHGGAGNKEVRITEE